MNVLTIDVETSTQNKGHVFTPSNFLVSCSLKRNGNVTTFHYFTDPDFLTRIREAISNADLVIGFNVKFDLHWLHRVGIIYTGRVFDCSLAEFILSGQEAVMVSLDSVLESYGFEAKDDRVKEYWDNGVSTEDIPVEVLEEYNNRDVDLTYQLYLAQLQLLSEKLLNLVMLDGDDMLTLIEAEANGMPWNREAASVALAAYKEKVDVSKQTLWNFVPEEARQWFNWDSGDDLSVLLYGGSREYAYATEENAVYKSGEKKGQEYIKRSWHVKDVSFPQWFRPLENTLVAKCLKPDYKGTLLYKVDEPTLKQLKTKTKEGKQLLSILHTVAKDAKIVEMLEELFKVSDQYEWQGNLLHGQFNQNIVRTGRLSSSKPNMQNKPVEVDEFLVSRYA